MSKEMNQMSGLQVKPQYPLCHFAELLQFCCSWQYGMLVGVAIVSLVGFFTPQLSANSCPPIFPCVHGSLEYGMLFWTPLCFLAQYWFGPTQYYYQEATLYINFNCTFVDTVSLRSLLDSNQCVFNKFHCRENLNNKSLTLYSTLYNVYYQVILTLNGYGCWYVDIIVKTSWVLLALSWKLE